MAKRPIGGAATRATLLIEFLLLLLFLTAFSADQGCYAPLCAAASTATKPKPTRKLVKRPSSNKKDISKSIANTIRGREIKYGGGPSQLSRSRKSGLHPILERFPEPVRFVFAGLLGTAAFYALDRALYGILLGTVGKKAQLSPASPGSKDPAPASTNSKLSDTPPAAALASISFVTAYLIQIVMQHLLNALLVYGPSTIATKSAYFKSLTQTYATYSGGLVASTVINGWMIRMAFSRDVAFWTSLLSVGGMNYAVLGWLNRRAEKGTSSIDYHYKEREAED